MPGAAHHLPSVAAAACSHGVRLGLLLGLRRALRALLLAARALQLARRTLLRL